MWFQRRLQLNMLKPKLMFLYAPASPEMPFLFLVLPTPLRTPCLSIYLTNLSKPRPLYLSH